MISNPVDVIIPHFRGREKFFNCLKSLFQTTYKNFSIIVVDNNSEDGSIEEAKRLFPQIEIISLNKNKGFAGGCNAGIAKSKKELVALLNDDTEVEPEWLTHLVRVISSDENIAVAQPRLHWILDKRKFDYAGGMGGLMDIFGYPFCYGRMFETVEIDKGQYDWVEDIFWASGSACLFRRKCYLEAGGLDERFFAHQEEIDLNWRLQLMGYRVKVVPLAIVYHYAGATLPAENFKKKYLNHRNSILLLLKNYQMKTLLWVLPIRLLLEFASIFLAIKQRDYRRILAVLKGAMWNLINFPNLFKMRREVSELRRLSDAEIMKRLYKGTVALQYYIFGKRTWEQLTRKK